MLYNSSFIRYQTVTNKFWTFWYIRPFAPFHSRIRFDFVQILLIELILKI